MPTSVTTGLVARVTQPVQPFEVSVAVPACALMNAPLPPPAANDRAGAVIEMLPPVAITPAGPPAPPSSVIELLAASDTEVPCTVAPLIAIVVGSIFKAPLLIRLALMTMAPGDVSFRLLP